MIRRRGGSPVPTTDADVPLGQPIFFGPTTRRRFGMLHRPAQPARGAAILCPPLGYEGVCAHAALRDLAGELAQHGVLALRIDYDGTGNSVGSDSDPDRVRCWIASISDAIDLVRQVGFDSITLVGVRIGATLAASAARARPEVSGLVLWDPVQRGRRYVRALKVLAATGDTGTETADGAVHVAGLAFTAQTLASLGQLRLDAGDFPGRVLVVEPTDSPADSGRPQHEGHRIEVLRLPGTAELLDVTVESAVVPRPIVEAVRGWIVDNSSCEAQIPVSATIPSTTDHAVESVGGRLIRHRAVRIDDGQLFATVTAPAVGAASRAVVMLNNGSAPQVGPGRAWVVWARQIAATGTAVMRLDLAGLGDSPAAPGYRPHDPYPVAAGANIAAAVGALRGQGVRRIALLGLCSGAMLCFDGLRATPDIDACVLLNGGFDLPWTDRRGDRPVRAAGQTVRPLAFALGKKPLFPVFDRVPRSAWWLLDKLRLCASPARSLQSVSEHRARILLLFGSQEWGLRCLRRRSGPEFEDILRSGRCELEIVRGLDHSMFHAAGRDRALVRACEFIGRELGARSVVSAEATMDAARVCEGVREETAAL